MAIGSSFSCVEIIYIKSCTKKKLHEAISETKKWPSQDVIKPEKMPAHFDDLRISYETVELNCILSSTAEKTQVRERKDAKKWILIARKWTVEQTLVEAIPSAGRFEAKFPSNRS